MPDEPETTTVTTDPAPEALHPVLQQVEDWFSGHVIPMAFRFDASVYNDLQTAKEELKNLLLQLL